MIEKNNNINELYTLKHINDSNLYAKTEYETNLLKRNLPKKKG